MTEQLSLPVKSTIQYAFEKFDDENPHIYDMIVRFTQDIQHSGRRKTSISLIIERIRWEVYTSTTTQDVDFKISNDFRSRYVRKLVEDHPEFREMFVMKELRTP